MGKECMARLSRRLWGGTSLKTAAKEANELCGSKGGFHVTSSPPSWWTKTKDLSLASFVLPPAIVHYIIVICVSRDRLQTTYW